MSAVERLAAELWLAAEPLVVPHNGGATEMFVLDLPVTGIRRTLEHFRQWAEPVTITTDPYEGRDLAVALASAIAANPVHVHLSGRRFTERDVQLFLLLNDDGVSYDAELVFWSDLWFPADAGRSDHFRRFVDLVELAEFLRIGSPESICIFSTEHNSDPRELLDGTGVVTW